MPPSEEDKELYNKIWETVASKLQEEFRQKRMQTIYDAMYQIVIEYTYVEEDDLDTWENILEQTYDKLQAETKKILRKIWKVYRGKTKEINDSYQLVKDNIQMDDIRGPFKTPNEWKRVAAAQKRRTEQTEQKKIDRQNKENQKEIDKQNKEEKKKMLIKNKKTWIQQQVDEINNQIPTAIEDAIKKIQDPEIYADISQDTRDIVWAYFANLRTLQKTIENELRNDDKSNYTVNISMERYIKPKLL